MKFLFNILILLFFTSCTNETIKLSETRQLPDSTTSISKTIIPLSDSVLTLQIDNNFHHHNIINHSDKIVDMLYNGVNNYFGGKQNMKINFHTECMMCEPVQEYENGLLFAQRMLIMPDRINYYKKDRTLPDSINRIKLYVNYSDSRSPLNLKFSEGNGTIRYSGNSCQDAVFKKVELHYSSKKKVIIDSLLNAIFFEYDINKNGQKEQYLMGSRNCTQEFILLRIRNRNDLRND